MKRNIPTMGYMKIEGKIVKVASSMLRAKEIKQEPSYARGRHNHTLPSLMKEPGHGWGVALTANVRRVIQAAGFIIVPRPSIEMLPDLDRPELWLCVHSQETPGVESATRVFELLGQGGELPRSLGLVVVGPSDTPLSQYDSAGSCEGAVLLETDCSPWFTGKRVIQDEIHLSWLIEPGRRESFQLERHVCAGQIADSPRGRDKRPTREFPLQELIEIPLGVRLATLLRRRKLPEPIKVKKSTDGITLLCWSNAQITALHELVIRKELVTSRSSPQTPRSSIRPR